MAAAASDTVEDLRSRLTQNERSGLYELRLNNKQLTKIPNSLFELLELQEVWLEDNYIKKIPKEVANLTSLRWIALWNNKLTKLPEQLGDLLFLEGLVLDENYLKKLPNSLGKLRNLRLLHLINNKFDVLPLCICDMESLEELDMTTSWLYDLPNEMTKLQKIKDLKLSNSCFKKIPDVIFKLNSLESLEMNKNKLDELPSDIMKLLNLQSLSLENNYIEILPVQMIQLKKLREIRMEGNPMKQPPLYVCNSNVRSVFCYLQELERTASVRIGRQKLMLCGFSEAGKTSLQISLVTGKPTTTNVEDRTVVLSEKNWMLEENVWLQVIDFGGHDVYTIMPQYFLSDNSIVLVVVDLSSYTPELFAERVGLWLGQLVTNSPGTPTTLVGTHIDKCTESEIQEKKTDILNRTSTFHEKLRSSLETRRKEIEKQLKKMKQKYDTKCFSTLEKDLKQLEHLIKKQEELSIDFVAVSSITGKGLYELKEWLKKIVEDKKIVLPSSWHRFASKILEMAKSSPDLFLTWEQARNIKWETSTNMEAFWSSMQSANTNDKGMMDVFESLHQMGCVLFYPENKKLSQVIFHNWPKLVLLLQAVLRHDIADVLTYEKFQDFFNTRHSFVIDKDMFLSQGMLTMPLFRGLLKHFKLDEMSTKTIVNLLEQFDLCYEVASPTDDDDKAKLHFPWYLKSDRPQSALSMWSKKTDKIQHQLCLEVCFRSHIPIGYFERLVVQLEKHVRPFRESRSDWKDGLYTSYNCTKVLIERVPKDAIITIQTRNSDVAEMWKIICCVFEDVQELLKQWAGVFCDCFFICPHCVATEAENPVRRNAEDILIEAESMKDKYVIPCKNADGDIPSVLIYPVQAALTREQEEALKAYKRHLNIKEQSLAGVEEAICQLSLEDHKEPPSAEPVVREPAWSAALRQHRTELIKNLTPDEVLERLLEKDVLSQLIYEKIKGVNKVRAEIVIDLLDELVRLNETAFDSFLEILNDTGHTVLAEHLEGGVGETGNKQV